MTKPKNILFIVSRLPINLETGDRLRVYYFIKNLCKRGHQVDILGYVPAGGYIIRTDIEELCGKCVGVEKEGIEFRNPSRMGQLKAFAGSLFQSVPYRVWWWYHQGFIAKALQMMDQSSYDVIHFSAPAAGVAFKTIKQNQSLNGPRLVYDMIDSFSMKLKKLLSGGLSPFWPFRYIDHWRLKKFEQGIVQDADQAILISERDKQFLGVDSCKIIPNGVEESPAADVCRDIDLLFVGNMAAESNIDAVEWFANEIFPALKRWNEDIHFYIAGANPTSRVKQLGSRQITVTGYVEDINAYYRRAQLFVCPMRKGAGQKNKILEAMINQTPVLSTQEGNIGIDAPLTAIAIADSAEAFIEQVKNMLEKPQQRNQLAQNGYRFVRDNFSWEQSIDLLEQCYQS